MTTEFDDVTRERIEAAFDLMAAAVRMHLAGWRGEAFWAGLGEAIRNMAAVNGLVDSLVGDRVFAPHGDIAIIPTDVPDDEAVAAARSCEAVACFCRIELERVFATVHDETRKELAIVMMALEGRIQGLAACLPYFEAREVLDRVDEVMTDPRLQKKPEG